MSVSINTIEVSDTEVYLHPMSVPYSLYYKNENSLRERSKYLEKLLHFVE